MEKGNYVISVGRQISRQRKRLGYTQLDLIERLSEIFGENASLITEKQLSRIENGTSGTTIENYNMIFRALNKSPDYFMLGIADDAIADADIIINDIVVCLKDCDIKYLKDILLIAKAFAENSGGK